MMDVNVDLISSSSRKARDIIDIHDDIDQAIRFIVDGRKCHGQCQSSPAGARQVALTTQIVALEEDVQIRRFAEIVANDTIKRQDFMIGLPDCIGRIDIEHGGQVSD